MYISVKSAESDMYKLNIMVRFFVSSGGQVKKLVSRCGIFILFSLFL